MFVHPRKKDPSSVVLPEVYYFPVQICHICTIDIYYRSVCSRKKDPFSVVLPEVSYFPCLGCFKFFLTQFKVLRAEDVTTVQSVKAQ